MADKPRLSRSYDTEKSGHVIRRALNQEWMLWAKASSDLLQTETRLLLKEFIVTSVAGQLPATGCNYENKLRRERWRRPCKENFEDSA
jgi:hypothetical protein